MGHRHTLYEHTDVPPGMTLAEYRRRRVRPLPRPGRIRRALGLRPARAR